MKQLARYDGPFGKVRIFERLSDGARAFATAGSLQTLIDTTGTSLFGYVHALKLLLKGRKTILMLGGGGGSLATMLARKGHDVTVVDIDPMAETIARQYFDLDPRVKWLVADGLTYPSLCRSRFDAIIVDACTANGIAAGFVEARWISGVMATVKGDGALMLNIAYNLGDEGKIVTDGFSLVEKLDPYGFHCTLLRPEYGWEGNEILIVSRKLRPVAIHMDDVMQRPAEVRSYLLSLKLYRMNAAET